MLLRNYSDDFPPMPVIGLSTPESWLINQFVPNVAICAHAPSAINGVRANVIASARCVPSAAGSPVDAVRTEIETSRSAIETIWPLGDERLGCRVLHFPPTDVLTAVIQHVEWVPSQSNSVWWLVQVTGTCARDAEQVSLVSEVVESTSVRTAKGRPSSQF